MAVDEELKDKLCFVNVINIQLRLKSTWIKSFRGTNCSLLKNEAAGNLSSLNIEQQSETQKVTSRIGNLMQLSSNLVHERSVAKAPNADGVLVGTSLRANNLKNDVLYYFDLV